MKIAAITQNRQKCLIFIMVPQLRTGDGSRFFKNDVVTEVLNNHNDNSICLDRILNKLNLISPHRSVKEVEWLSKFC